MPESTKQKLTLSVSKEAVEKARKIGLNLSDITERVLQGRTSIPSDADEAEVHAHYKALFLKMQPFLTRYRMSIHIGDYHYFEDDGTVVRTEALDLTPSGKIWSESEEDDQGEEVELEGLPVWSLFDGNKILSNFIESLSEAKQKNQERIDQLQLASRIIEVMTESMGKQPKKQPHAILPARISHSSSVTDAKSNGGKQPG